MILFTRSKDNKRFKEYDEDIIFYYLVSDDGEFESIRKSSIVYKERSTEEDFNNHSSAGKSGRRKMKR